MHSVYGGAHLFNAGTAKKMSEAALKALADYAPSGAKMAAIFGEASSSADNSALWNKVYSRVEKKLKTEAVEDFRIDFEDGYGNRPDSEEDGHAESTAREVALGLKNNSLPPFVGIRIKPLSNECSPRSLRTLEIFISTLAKETGNKPAAPFHRDVAENND